MATTDLSRSATDFRKHYASWRMQQGRVLSDDEVNDGVRLAQESERRTNVDVIGATGSPDDGFLITNPATSSGVASFDIGSGTLYLGGLRLDMEVPEPYVAQLDWLEQGAADAIPPLALGQTERFDLVYVEALQHAVSGVEDSELLEVALGGPDGGTRIRTMRRVKVMAAVSAADCHQAWSDLAAKLAGEGTLNDELELVPDVTLTVGFVPGGDPDDLCSPPVAGGYLGAENQAIRVQLVDADHFTWGFDNAAPLYRVRVGTNANGQRRVITMITEPRDQAHWPLAGQIVELLPWSEALPNWEKTAELAGLLARVDGSYDPDTQKFTIDTAVPSGFGEAWKSRPDKISLAPTPDDEFFFLRVWNRGSDTTSDPAVSFTAGTPVTLGHTGLNVTINGTQRPATCHWIIAARPASPNRVVPWQLESGRKPHGYRRFLAPLAVIHWQAGGGSMTGEVVSDCRQTFPPLTRIRTCCTYTVGDGVNSQGHYASIQAAVDHLPPDGGEVCVLPGLYHENVVIDSRRNITIHGCGRRSQVVSAPAGNAPAAPPVFQVQNSSSIRIERLAVIADDTGIGVLLEPGTAQVGGGEFPQQVPGTLIDVALAELFVTAATQSAIEVRGGELITIVRCEIEMKDVPSAWPGVFFIGEDGLIERNGIHVRSARQKDDGPFIPMPVHAGLGGLQIGGTAARVRVLENLIQSGIGNGITLGSIEVVNQDGNDTGDLVGWVVNANDPCSPCLPGDTQIPDPGGGGGTRQVSAGPLYDISVACNRILDMGLNGIGVVGFFNLDAADEMISVNGLSIEANEIQRCVGRPLNPVPTAMLDSMGYGGIALADVTDLVIRENVIQEIGMDRLEPVCGVFVLHGQGVDISLNRILTDSPTTEEPVTSAKEGRRGGINIVYCVAPTVPVTVLKQEVPVANGVPALKVHDNVVSVPLGQALWALALGPVSVQGNQFTTHGVVSRQPGASSSFLAATVAIGNLGVSNELYGQLVAFSQVAQGQLKLGGSVSLVGDNLIVPQPGLDDIKVGQYLADGNVLFTDNQCVLNLLETGTTFAVSSILIWTLDDVGFLDNQSDCNLLDDFVISDVILFGFSLRASDNRLKEGVKNALFSAVTFGYLNTTMSNQATHCLLVLPPTPNPRVVDAPNTVLVAGGVSEYCARFAAQVTKYMSAFGG